MKTDINDLEKTYEKCICSGCVKEKNSVDIELIKSLKNMAELSLNFIKKESKNLEKDSTDWTFVFRDYYETLRALIEAYLLFDKVQVDNHQCNNSYLCIKHPELELNWEFLETVRLKRNAMNYRGQLIKYEDWDKLKLEFDLHISKMSKEIENRLEEEGT